MEFEVELANLLAKKYKLEDSFEIVIIGSTGNNEIEKFTAFKSKGYDNIVGSFIVKKIEDNSKVYRELLDKINDVSIHYNMFDFDVEEARQIYKNPLEFKTYKRGNLINSFSFNLDMGTKK